jgi:hypothetical protein
MNLEVIGVPLVGIVAGLFLVVVLGFAVRREGWPFLVAFLGTVATVIVMVLLEPFIPGLTFVVVVTTAIVAAWDSWQMRYSEYEGGNNPLIVFLGCLAMWLLVLPWYLGRRWRISQGTMPRRASAEERTRGSR